eukprot:CAMPEP_0179424558 /NCGR_PEP_ID=MMETSP0799-20121207/11662_1 /TAXON_ID=46947 /ORGANISM="Geminigera cryophila, Strain CCMP2564" /LENGTH=79 /DNA_ID=CAMNT_0021199037 /DNA_START=311 /DNA_END=551 /DNA_ORIENTATION=+
MKASASQAASQVSVPVTSLAAFVFTFSLLTFVSAAVWQRWRWTALAAAAPSAACIRYTANFFESPAAAVFLDKAVELTM